MKFEHKDVEYIVKFGYYYSKRKRIIECVIYTQEEGYDNPLIRETIYYPENEHFSKKRARNLVLKETLSPFTESFRLSVWDAYFTESKIYPRYKKVKNG